MNLIGISGKREAGKSLLAKCLEKYGYTRVSLASPLKEMCKGLYGLTDEQVYGQFKEHPTHLKRTDGSLFTPRDILIREGCLKRSIDPFFWCKLLANDLAMNPIWNAKYVIDDIRFLNEIEYFKKLGAKFVRIERDQQLKPHPAALDDLSETELDTYKAWDALLLAEHNRYPDDLERFANYVVTQFESNNANSAYNIKD